MDIRKYIYSHCVQPITLNVYNAATGTYENKQVPCGKCLHCRNTRVNEWTTRLYAHAKYVKNVYYITLDYAPFDTNNSVAMQLAADTAASYHNLNINHTYGLHPILIKKEHLQKFFKRLRKNSPEKSFQYFACMEYGHLYARPHAHIILFSNDTFTPEDIESAWTLDGYKIGRVDFHDLVQNGSFLEYKKDPTKNARYVFKYVCKYLQKNEFDFEKIPTLGFHKKYFESLQYVQKNVDELFPEYEKITDKSTIEQNWKEYCKKYSPFVCCSKRPAIGLQYFEENLERFQKQDFRLFGLSKECSAFPRYWLRKTKENLCVFDAISSINGNPVSNSRIGNVLSVLTKIRDDNYSVDNWSDDSPLLWRPDSSGRYTIRNDSKHLKIDNILYSFYDNKRRIFYYFTGYDFEIKQKVRNIGFVTRGHLSIADAINLLSGSWTDYYEKFLQKMQSNSDLNAYELEVEKNHLFPNLGIDENIEDKFRELVYKRYQQELQSWKIKGMEINNTKISF